MITIIHGDDIALSRGYLQEQKKNSANPHIFDGIIDLPTISQITQGGGLFDTQKVIFVENFFSKNKPSNPETKNVVEYINENEQKLNISFWEPNILQKKSLSLFNKATVKMFKIPQTIFLFLDNLRPSEYKNMINLFHNALKNTLEEIIFFMMQRQFRLLIAISDEKNIDSIDEVTRLAPWQKSKLERQASFFQSDKLKTTYKKLYQIELAQKTGALPYSLICAIDFLLADL
ncbi:MAG: hypothetical protein A3E40_04725 [Candidatus Levybacteria bacterium RIFCSPHIGHO2_12_FULL_37_9]|nr:MAG: hypothetical protein A3E40_04725 [Candidatus Levybacteria bacterium RIFCSPHIGHO2_12_FULL_37_9]